ncbi:ABC transporter thiamine pyrophosphate-binding lipoprotein p37/Cypl [Mycoplasma sp. 1890]
MKNKKIAFILSLSTLMSTFAFISIACSAKQDANLTLKFVINEPFFGNKKHLFFSKILSEFKKKINKDATIKVRYVSANNDIASIVRKKTSNVAIITTPLFIRNNDQNIIPILQTMTRAFKFDKNFNDSYSDGSNTDKLRIIAAKLQKLFNKKSYTAWTDEEYSWNGNIYEYFYAKNNELVEYYRGIIMIQGTNEEREQIKKAWDNKDWNTFRNFGIVTGKESSGSKYILQEALFKKHFNLENNKFNSFAEDKIKNIEKYTQGEAKNIANGSLKKYHIVFDEMASFAYRNNKRGKFYTPDDENVKIEFLTATDPLKYNVVVVNKDDFNTEQINYLKNIIIDLWRKNEDDYGPTVGFNGYKIINDVDKEVIQPYNKIFS